MSDTTRSGMRDAWVEAEKVKSSLNILTGRGEKSDGSSRIYARQPQKRDAFIPSSLSMIVLACAAVAYCMTWYLRVRGERIESVPWRTRASQERYVVRSRGMCLPVCMS